MNLLLKTNGGRGRKPNFAVFVVWSALIVSRWMVVTWFIFCVPGLIQGWVCSSRMGDVGGSKISSFSL